MKIIILILSVLLGAFATQILTKNKNSLKLLLSFSGALLLSMMFQHLIPDLYLDHEVDTKVISFWIIGGFLLQLLLDYYSQGIEHGHVHIKKKGMPWLVCISLLIHALIEGLPIGAADLHHGHHHGHDHQGLALVWGIALHKLPISIALTTLLIQSEVKLWARWGFILVFALMTPLGVYLSGLSFTAMVNVNYFTALLVGMLLHVSTTILFESSDKHKYAIGKFLAILFGLGLGFML